MPHPFPPEYVVFKVPGGGVGGGVGECWGITILLWVATSPPSLPPFGWEWDGCGQAGGAVQIPLLHLLSPRCPPTGEVREFPNLDVRPSATKIEHFL